MKKFDSLEQEEKALLETTPKSVEKKSVPYLPIVVGVIAIAIIVIVCVKLFGRKPTSNTTTAKKYEVEVDGKTYSADTIEELNEMVGFDISFAFNNQNDKELSTHVEKDLYEANETATIETESGTYSMEVTDAIITQRAPSNGGDILYQITYTIKNQDFGKDSSGVLVDPSSLAVTDHSGNVCENYTSWNDGEQENAYEKVLPGNSIQKKGIYKVADATSPYLNIQIKTRGVNFRIPIGNLDVYTESHKEQKIDYGTPVTISNMAGELNLTVDDIKIANDYLFEQSDTEDLFIVFLDIDNISYKSKRTSGLASYQIGDLIEVKDDKGYVIPLSYQSTKENIINGYNTYPDDVSVGSKVRCALMYMVPKSCNKITIDFKNGSTLDASR